MPLPLEESYADKELGNEEVKNKDQHGRRYNCGRGGTPNSLRSAGCGQTKIAAYQRDNYSEKERLK